MKVSGSGTPSTAHRKVLAIVPQSSSAALTSTGIDTLGWDWADVELSVGAMTATGTIDLTVEESDTLGGTYAAITGAVMAQKLAASGGSKIYSGQIECRKRKRFIRVVSTQATAASLVSVQVTLSGAARTELVQAAQLGSSPAATPLAADAATGGCEFTV